MVGLVLLGHDLGTVLVMFILVAGALFVTGLPMRICAFAGVLAGLAVTALTKASSNGVGRIFSWLNDTCDGQGACYQSKHGIWGLATGGGAGLGLGSSRQKWGYVPERQNDYIFAIIGEVLSLIGMMFVLALFLLIMLAMARIIRRHSDPFVKVATAAIMC